MYAELEQMELGGNLVMYNVGIIPACCLPKRTAVVATLSLTRSVDEVATIDMV